MSCIANSPRAIKRAMTTDRSWSRRPMNGNAVHPRFAIHLTAETKAELERRRRPGEALEDVLRRMMKLRKRR